MIYDAMSNDLQQLSFMLRNPSAQAAFLYHEDEFLGQHESRALLLEAEFDMHLQARRPLHHGLLPSP